MKHFSYNHTAEFKEDSGFTEDMISSSEGAGIFSCNQSGTYSASCPVYELMDYPPRTVFAILLLPVKSQRINRIMILSRGY